jgi:uncharacterized membrane protein
MTTVNKRIHSIDILRGLVMVIMALDHTRDFFHAGLGDPMDADTTSIYLFFTRWITHFCAPTFLFLSGVSAYLSSRNKDPKTASNFLIKRGLWLILAEMVIVTLALTFNPQYNFIVLTVIWAIGCSMVILGLLSRISYRLVLIVGLILFFGHNLSTYFLHPTPGTLSGGIIGALFTARATIIPLGSNYVIGIFYTILPWTGAMLLGFSIGPWYNAEFGAEKRRKLLFYTGLGLFVSFIVLRYFNLYGNPTPRKEYAEMLKSFFSFLDLSKYPPSLQYYGMTLGPALMLLSAIENVKNRFTKIIMVYGNVPFFYYIMHLFLIHFILVIVFFVKGYGAKDIVTPKLFIYFLPPGIGFNLVTTYLFWFLVVALLYLPCLWFQKYKATHTNWWLRYL